MADEPMTPQPQAEPSFDMGDLKDAFVDGVDSIEMGDDGFLDMQIAPLDDDLEYDDDGYEPDQLAPATVTETPVAEPEVPWEKRYNDLRPEFTKVTTENSDLRKRLDVLEREAKVDPALQKPEQTGVDQVPEDLYDLISDPQAFNQSVGKIAKEVIAEAMSLYVPSDMVAQWRVNNEIQQAMLNHENFHDMLPHMETVFKRFPDADLSIEQAYELASFALESVTGRKQGSQEQPSPAPATIPETPAPSTPALTREELIARSLALQTAEGNTNDDGFDVEETVKTPRDAIMAALRDMEDNS